MWKLQGEHIVNAKGEGDKVIEVSGNVDNEN